MFRRSIALVAAVAAAASLGAAVPASAADTTVAAASICRGDVGLAYEEWHQTIIVTGAYAPARAIDVQLTCGVVRYGETVARVTETRPGPVAVVHGSARVVAGPVSFCYEAVVTYLDRTEYLDTCP